MDTKVNPLQRINCYVINIRVAYIFGAREEGENDVVTLMRQSKEDL